MSVALSTEAAAKGRTRFTIVAVLFAITLINYADRAALGIAGPAVSKSLGLSHVEMGFIFSAFGWSYVIAQVPGGWLLDRFGSKRVYFWGIFAWSLFTLLQGMVGIVGAASAVSALFGLRLLVGAAEAPSFPGNARIVAAWFPANERGTASAIFNSAQYFATVLFAPIMGWLTFTYGWPAAFYFMGGLGIFASLVWLKTVYSPHEHPRLRPDEFAYIENGGALTSMDAKGRGKSSRDSAGRAREWGHIRILVQSRMMLGIYLGQFCINTLTYFFITWFPVYLVQQRHMSILHAGFVASIPAVCGFCGGVLGGIWSDFMLRRGFSLTAARKTPIVAGMLLSMVMVVCNYVDAQWLVVGAMALAFFGKGIGALGWAVVSDTVPKQIAGLSGGLFNMFGNLSTISTPIVIGYIIQRTGSFNGALVFVGANALAAVVSYLFIVGEIRRLAINTEPAA